MSSRIGVAIAIIAIVMGIAFISRSPSPTPPTTESTVSTPTPISSPTENAATPTNTPVSVNSTPSPSAVKTVTEIAPQIKTIRKEVAKNPHETPISILEFASALGEKMDAAIQKPELADPFFSELKDCVHESEKFTPAIRAICLSNAQHLSEKYPALQDQYRNLKQLAPPEVNRLVH